MSTNLTFVIETRLPQDDDILVTEVPVEIDKEGISSFESLSARLEIMPNVVSEARKNIASRHIDFDAYSSDSDYLDTLDRLANDVEIVSIREKLPEGGKPVRIYFEAEYDDGGVFGEEVWGASKEDGIFQGAWLMAVRNGSDGKGENIEDLLDSMDSVEVLMGYCKPVTEEEIINLLGRLAGAAKSGENLDEVLAEARGVLETLAGNGEMQDWQEAAQTALASLGEMESAPRM